MPSGQVIHLILPEDSGSYLSNRDGKSKTIKQIPWFLWYHVNNYSHQNLCYFLIQDYI